MQNITKHLVYLFLLLAVSQLKAQEKDSIPRIESIKETITTEERDALKLEIETINDQLEEDEITFEEAEQLKKEAAEKRALNIENRIAIAVNRVEYFNRNNAFENKGDKNVFSVKIGAANKELLGIRAIVLLPKKTSVQVTKCFLQWVLIIH